jgi:hypothetical protein
MHPVFKRSLGIGADPLALAASDGGESDSFGHDLRISVRT